MKLFDHAPNGRIRFFSLLTVTALTTALLMNVVPSGAIGDSVFEVEGNLVVDGGKDWASLGISCMDDLVTPTVSEIKGCALDKATGSGDDSFGNGTKEDSAVPSVIDGSIPNNKSDLTRFYVANERVGTHEFLYLAWERVQEPNGTTNMDFEFNQSKTKSANGVTPVRTAGDVLVKYDLSQGGARPTIGYHYWQDGATSGYAEPCFSANSFPCWGPLHQTGNTNADGAVNNTGVVTDPILAPNQSGPRQLSLRTFGEAAIDLTAAGVFNENICSGFGSAYLKSRSSDSFTAAVKDFIAPIPVEISNCAPVTIKLKKVDTANQPLSGAVLQLFKDDNGAAGLQATAGPGGVPPADPQVGSDCTTSADGIGNCSFVLPGSLASNGTYIGHEKTPPPGYSLGAPDQTHTVTIDSLTQEFILEFTDSPAPGTINITKVDNATTPNRLNGATFTVYVDAGNTGPTDAFQAGIDDQTPLLIEGFAASCTTSGTGPDAGRCSIGNVPLGNYWVIETVTPAGYSTADPQRARLGLGTGAGTGQTISLIFVNPIVLGTINVTKQDNASPTPNRLNGAGFTVYVDAGNTGPADAFEVGVDNMTTLTLAGNPCTTAGTGAAAGTCSFVNVPLGNYWVVETTTPAGYATAPPQRARIVQGQSVGTGTVVSLTFTDNLVLGTINIVKQDDSSPPVRLNGATFRLFVDAGTINGSFQPGIDDVTLASVTGNPCTTAGTSPKGVCSFSDVPLGDYWVVESQAPEGYDRDVPQHVTVVKGTAANTGYSVTLTFSDPRLHRVIAFVCHEGSDTLTGSSVTVGAEAKSTITAVPPALAAKGVTEADLCASFGGAVFGGKPHGAMSATVTIEGH